LFEREDWKEGANRTQIGWVLAIPQVPPWMSEYFPDVVAAEEEGGPAISEFGREWFESLVWIHKNSYGALVMAVESPESPHAANAKSLLVALTYMDISRQIIAASCCDGCSRSAPVVRAIELKINDKFDLVTAGERVCECLVDKLKNEKVALEIDIVDHPPDKLRDPVALAQRLRAFVDLPKHQEWKKQDPSGQKPLAKRMLNAIRKL